VGGITSGRRDKVDLYRSVTYLFGGITLDRKQLMLPFLLASPPDWTCPTCNKGVLLIKEDSFVKQETRQSKLEWTHEAWDPDWIRYVYSCVLQCNNAKCKEHVFSVGTGTVGYNLEEDSNGRIEQVTDDFFIPRFFEPHLCIIQIPENCPASISNPLKESFNLFFSSPNAAANNIRIAIEELLTELRVKRFIITKGRQRRPINLHQRIDLLPAKYAKHKDMMLAIKWLGNAGSHDHGKVTANDVTHSGGGLLSKSKGASGARETN
jgi:hypothetical protein